MSGDSNNNKPSHLRALLRKNWILWKRSWCVSLCEILIPFAFSFILIVFKNNASTNGYPVTTYYNQPSYAFNFDGILNSNLIKDCNKEGGGLVAISPDPTTDSLAFDVNQALGKT